MPRVKRVDVAGEIYHVINRANARVTIFESDQDYKNFENILEEALKKYDIKLYAYCIMPNHFHLVLSPNKDGQLSLFMGWLTNTHTRRWHTAKNTIGHGHLYQGRYKSFICQNDLHFLTLVKYVERNAKRAKLVREVQSWKWGSAWRRYFGTSKQKSILSKWPIIEPLNYLKYLNETQNEKDVDIIRRSIIKNIPFGEEGWVNKTVDKFNLGQSLRRVGRPRK